MMTRKIEKFEKFNALVNFVINHCKLLVIFHEFDMHCSLEEKKLLKNVKSRSNAKKNAPSFQILYLAVSLDCTRTNM